MTPSSEQASNSLMTPDRPIVRLMAAMILAILACVASSAVQAHEGHALHAGHRSGHGAAMQARAAPSTAVPAITPAQPTVRAEAPASSKTATKTAFQIAAVAPVRDDGCCPGPCRARCCGTMACCAAGILSGPPAPAPVPVRAVRLVPRDVPGRAGPGLEALPRPPRTLA